MPVFSTSPVFVIAKRIEVRIPLGSRFHPSGGILRPLANRRCVQDESIVVEHDEVNVFVSHHFNRAANRRITENRRTLLRKLDEENLTDAWVQLNDFSGNSQRGAKRRANPSIGAL